MTAKTVENLTALPPTGHHDGSPGASAPNPTHVSTSARQGPKINPMNTSGAQIPNDYPYMDPENGYAVWGR